MKMKVKYYFMFFIVFFLMTTNISLGQDSNFGDDPGRCRINLSTYTEFFNQKNYKDALPAWRWCFLNCPASTRNIYINGIDIIEYFIEISEDEDTKQAYIDTLMMVYDNRIKYFNQESMVLGRKAIALLKHRPNEVLEAYEIMKRSFKVGGFDTEFHVLGYYKNIAVVLFSNGLIDNIEIVNLYTQITEVLENQIENELDENRASRIQSVKERVEELFVNSGAADCNTIIEIFGPQIENNPDDIELVKKVSNLLDTAEGKEEECKGEFYLNLSVMIYNSEKTARAAHSIAQTYFRRNEPKKAEKFYLEAVEMEEDNIRKADMYYELALMYFSQLNQNQTARTFARKSIAKNPNHGRAYMLIGRIYAAGGRDCGETVLERKALWWVVVDQFIKARSVDPSVADDANEFIRRYSSNFPTQEEGFWENVHEGDSFHVKCWINESTTVRFIK